MDESKLSVDLKSSNALQYNQGVTCMRWTEKSLKASAFRQMFCISKHYVSLFIANIFFIAYKTRNYMRYAQRENNMFYGKALKENPGLYAKNNTCGSCECYVIYPKHFSLHESLPHKFNFYEQVNTKVVPQIKPQMVPQTGPHPNPQIPQC